jgi:hypothetical protein
VDHLAAGQSAGQSSLQGKASSKTKNKIRIGGQFQTKFGKITFGVVVSFSSFPLFINYFLPFMGFTFLVFSSSFGLFFWEISGVDLK